jgi:hypothetical protein
MLIASKRLGIFTILLLTALLAGVSLNGLLVGTEQRLRKDSDL